MYPRMLGTALGRLLLLIFGLAPLPAMASLPTGPGTNILTSVAASPDSVSGFRWMAALITTKTAVRRRSRSAAPQFDSVPFRGSIAAIPGKEGYWIVTDLGAICARGLHRPPRFCSVHEALQERADH